LSDRRAERTRNWRINSAPDRRNSWRTSQFDVTKGRAFKTFFMPQADEQVASTSAVRAFFIAVLSGVSQMDTFDPVKSSVSDCFNAVAVLFADDL
jgi:hypothetical protein